MSYLPRILAITLLLFATGGAQANPRVGKLKKKKPATHQVDTLKGASRFQVARHFRSWRKLANYYAKSKTADKQAPKVTVPQKISDGKKRLRKLKANLPPAAPRIP